MVKSALDGNIDLIITKSVSRFARNTVDSLTTIRKLKDINGSAQFTKRYLIGGSYVNSRRKISGLKDD